MQFIPIWLLWYFAIGTLMGAPFVLAFRKALNEEGTREPSSWLEKRFFEIIRKKGSIERMRIEILQDRYMFMTAIIIMIFWLPILFLVTLDITKIEIKFIRIAIYKIYFKYRSWQFYKIKKKFELYPNTYARKFDKQIKQTKRAVKLYHNALENVLKNLAEKDETPR